MRATTSSDDVRREFRWLLLLAVAFSWLLFVSRYAYFPLYLLHRTIPGLESLLFGVYWVLFAGDLLFTQLWLYVGLSVVGLVLVIAAWVKAGSGRLGRVGLLVGLLAITAMPVVYRYQPAVWVESEYAAQVITQPGVLGGVVKRVQAGTEMRACEYELLGWSASQGLLYGKEVCGQRSRIWAYEPPFDKRFHEEQSIPGDIAQEAVSQTSLEGVHSTIPLDESLNLAVRGPILVSAEREWYAFVARHIYGPEDVVVVAASPREP
jgi:hypothetical protein